MYEPSPGELAEIATEWPVIEAELAVVAAECRMAASSDPLAVRAHRRAVVALAAEVRRAGRTRRIESAQPPKTNPSTTA